MKARVDRKALLPALKIAGRAGMRNGNALLKVLRRSLNVTASDGQVAVTVGVDAEVDRLGAVALHLRALRDVVQAMPDETLSLTAKRSLIVSIAGSGRKAEVWGTPPKDEPPRPISLGERILSIPADALLMALQRTVFVAPDDDSRPVLTGVHFKADGRELTMAAADGFRLSRQRITLPDPPQEIIEMIIPSRALAIVQGLLREDSEAVHFALTRSDETWVRMAIGLVTVDAKLIAGTYPSFASLIPLRCPVRAEFDADELLAEIGVSSKISAWGSGITRLELRDGRRQRVALSSRGEEPNGTYKANVPASVNRESRIAFNARYLTDALKLARGKRVWLGIKDDKSPGRFRIVGDRTFDHVVMPMYVNWGKKQES